jgi:hypothetical protein
VLPLFGVLGRLPPPPPPQKKKKKKKNILLNYFSFICDFFLKLF